MSSLVTTDIPIYDAYFGTTNVNETPSLILTDIPEFNSKVEFRLSSGEGVNNGRLEVFIADNWGSICGEGWDLLHAQATCKWFGYRYALEATRGIRFGVGAPPFYNIICRENIDVLSDCSFYKNPDQQCNHWGFAGVVCFSLIPTVAVEQTSRTLKTGLPLSVISPLFALLILVPVVACIVWRKLQNGSANRSDFLQVQDRHLPSTPQEECIHIKKCVHETASTPLKPPVNIQNEGQIYKDPLYEQSETTLSTDKYCRALSSTKRFAAKSHEVNDLFPSGDGSSSSDTNTYHDLSDRENSSSDFPQIEHTYSEDAIRNNDDSVGAYRTYIDEDVYESIP
ncbi:Neurotrypsin [Holothuria leucospilota]|uniref:Neurotrypsin n=1 Tax=Holothuria leucospilota TaxID=206669 RepID=A0A9Q0YLD9_HOLLE|nr:Neurotrypsin [Holothuria leucospilota]